MHPEKRDILLTIGRRDIDLLNANRSCLIMRADGEPQVRVPQSASEAQKWDVIFDANQQNSAK